MKSAMNLLVITWLFSSFAVAAPTCPSPHANEVLRNSQQLLLVTSPGWNSHAARMRLYERSSGGGNWRPASSWQAAVIGRSGLAWGYQYQSLRKPGEPVKREGDGRTPAGVHRAGEAFGFAPADRPSYRQLTPFTVCVDDPASTSYNKIVEANAIPNDWKSAEQMREISVYKIGFAVDYLSNRDSQAGSCIFVHIWNGPESGTAGCLAAPEESIASLQKRLTPGAAIAFLPEEELAAWQACWKGATTKTAAPRDDAP